VTTVRVVVDRFRCIGSGNCVFWAPATFDLDDEGLSVPADPAADTREALQVAVDGCPTRAITLEVVHDVDPAPGDGGR
jgi:ferredoxin